MTPLQAMLAGIGVGFAFMVGRVIYRRVRGTSETPASKGAKKRR